LIFNQTGGSRRRLHPAHDKSFSTKALEGARSRIQQFREFSAPGSQALETGLAAGKWRP